MRCKVLGNTGVFVSTIGQGTGIGGYSGGKIAYEPLLESLRRGIELGMNLIDTAPVYGNGAAEEVVGKAIARQRDKVFLATKVPPEKTDHDGVLASAEESLRRLKVDCIDLYQIHWSNPKIAISETMKAMRRLVTEGKIRFVGVSNFTLKEFQAAQEALGKDKIVSLQAEYNLFDRTAETMLLPFCRSQQISFIAYSPLHRGKVTSGARRFAELKKIAARYQKTPAQVALRWLVAREPVIAIPNTTHPGRADENARSADFDLSADDLKRVEEICSLTVEQVPTEKIHVSAEHGKQVYGTLEEAKANRLGSVPSPTELADQIHSGEFLKPVRLIRRKQPSGSFEYDLAEGRIRYWAWVIAHEKNPAPIPALVEESDS